MLIARSQVSHALRPTSQPQFFHRLRFQLLGCLIVAVGLPYLVGLALLPDFSRAPQTDQALVGSIAALTMGTWLYRSLSTFPGIRASSYILPSFGLCYMAVITVFFLGRFEYNRLLLVAGFASSVAWFYAISVMVVRQRPMRIGVVGLEKESWLSEAGDIEWVAFDAPDQHHQAVDAVVTDLRVDLPDGWDRKLADYALEGVPVYHVKQLRESLTGRVELEHLSENSFGTLTPAYAYLQAKFLIDWLSAIVALCAILPVLMATVIAIRLDSPGPALFRQRRIGYRGRPFTVYKFRTMTMATGVDGDERSAAQTKPRDLRITRIGQRLRKLRIDELPQIFNILRGEMSWIGPRPEAEVLSKWYEHEIPFYRYRHIVRPGITGWAQVNQGHVIDVHDVTGKLHYDFYYIKNVSPWIDALIVAKTIQTVLTGFGHR